MIGVSSNNLHCTWFCIRTSIGIIQQFLILIEIENSFFFPRLLRLVYLDIICNMNCFSPEPFLLISFIWLLLLMQSVILKFSESVQIFHMPHKLATAASHSWWEGCWNWRGVQWLFVCQMLLAWGISDTIWRSWKIWNNILQCLPWLLFQWRWLQQVVFFREYEFCSRS